MMKLVSFAAIAGVASAARERTPPATSTRTRRQHQSDGPTKEKLESSTRQFVQDNLRQKSRATAKAPVDVGHYAPRKRALRSVSDREGRHGKAGKHEEGGGEDDDEDDDHGHMHGHGHGHGDDEYGHDDDEHGHGHDDDHHSHYDDDDSHAHGSDSKSRKRGKSGKSPKGGKSRDDEHEHEHEELFYLLPTACPNECITSMVTGNTYEFTDSIRQCKANEESHMWLVRSDGSYITIESYYDHGMCIAVDYQRGDAEAMLAETCYDGELVLKECDSDYGTEWYFTGGQLINSMCWGAGLSSLMTVFFEDDDNGNGDELVVKECKKDVAVWGANDEAVLKADTFMFVNRLPETPFVIDDVQAALDMAGNNANDVEGAE